MQKRKSVGGSIRVYVSFWVMINFYYPESIDNGENIVWTNLSPFESKQGNKDLKRELMQEGLKSTLELIKILQPRRIILLGINAFRQIEKTMIGQEP